MKGGLGALRQKFVIQLNTPTRTEAGAEVDSWATFLSVHGSVEPLIGREWFANNTMQQRVSHRIRMRYQAGILPKMRIFYDSRVLKIESVLNVEERDRELLLMCQEEI